MARDKRNSREVALEILYLLLRHQTGTHHLHYGYWKDLDTSVANLPKAQEAYCDFLLAHIPEGVKSVLDVGCGVGALARRFQDAGYEMECISPSKHFARYARELLDPGTKVHECYFEDFQGGRKYDLVLFSESFQYMKLPETLSLVGKLLNDGGHMLICDFFKIPQATKSPIGGGTRIPRFLAALENQPFELVEDVDITAETAPSMDLVNDLLVNVAAPGRDIALDFLRNRHPWIMRFMEWKFRRKLEKMERKYLTGQSNGANFTLHKTYRMLLFRKGASVPASWAALAKLAP